MSDQLPFDLNQPPFTLNTTTEWFPFQLTVGNDVKITLHKDGKWEGSMPWDLEAAMGGTHGFHESDPVRVLLLWLVLREMQRDIEAG